VLTARQLRGTELAVPELVSLRYACCGMCRTEKDVEFDDLLQARTARGHQGLSLHNIQERLSALVGPDASWHEPKRHGRTAAFCILISTSSTSALPHSGMPFLIVVLTCCVHATTACPLTILQQLVGSNRYSTAKNAQRCACSARCARFVGASMIHAALQRSGASSARAHAVTDGRLYAAVGRVA
jgi:hypothetical protein